MEPTKNMRYHYCLVLESVTVELRQIVDWFRYGYMVAHRVEAFVHIYTDVCMGCAEIHVPGEGYYLNDYCTHHHLVEAGVCAAS